MFGSKVLQHNQLFTVFFQSFTSKDHTNSEWKQLQKKKKKKKKKLWYDF